jgi:hypothetical protein
MITELQHCVSWSTQVNSQFFWSTADIKKPSKIPSSAYETTGSPMGALLKTYQNMWSLPTINLDHVLRVSPWVPHIYVNVYPREILSLINNALHFDG